MDIEPFPERRPRSPAPGHPKSKPETREWDGKRVDSRNVLRMNATIRHATIAERRREIADNEEAMEGQQATVEHVEHAPHHQAPRSPTRHFTGFPPSAHASPTTGPTLPALRPVSPSPQMGLPRAIRSPSASLSPSASVPPRAITARRPNTRLHSSEVQFQWSEPPDVVSSPARAPPIPPRSPRRGSIQFQWPEAPDLRPPTSHVSPGSPLVRRNNRAEYDELPSHGHPGPRAIPAPSTFRANSFGSADASSWMERLPLRPLLDGLVWNVPRSAWMENPPRTSAEDYNAISPEHLSSPVSSRTIPSSRGGNLGIHAYSEHLAGLGTSSTDFSSSYNNESLHASPPYRDTTHTATFSSHRDFLHTSYQDSTQAWASSSPLDTHTDSPHGISVVHVESISSGGSSVDIDKYEQPNRTSKHGSSSLSSVHDRHHRHHDKARSSTHQSSHERPRRDGEGELEEQPRKRSKHRSSHYHPYPQAHRQRHDEDDTRDRHGYRRRSSHRSSHHGYSHHERHEREDESTDSTTRRSSDSSHGVERSHHEASADSTARRTSHRFSHHGRHHQRDDSERSRRHGSSHLSSHDDRDLQYDKSGRSNSVASSGPTTNTSGGRATTSSDRPKKTWSTPISAQRSSKESWDANDSDQEGDVDSSIIDASTEPRSRATPFQPDLNTETIICAISESRAGDFVGIATLNLTTGRSEISHIINDDKFQYQRLVDVISKMEHLPHTFIVPEKLAKPGEAKSYLVRCLKREFPSVSIKPLQRSHWSETEGKRIVSESALDSEREAILAVLEKEFYVANAVSAVFEYARKEMGVTITPHSTCIKYVHPTGTLRLDRNAVGSLELIKTTKEGHSKPSSVFRIMDRTYTPAGRRLLRMSLLGPSTDPSEITHRQDAVEEFTNKQEFLSDTCKGLKALHRIDMERVITWIFRPEATPECPLAIGSVYSRNGVVLASHDDLQAAEWDLNHILMLKEYMEGVAALHKILEAEHCSSTLCRWLTAQLGPEKLSDTQSVVRGGINADAAFSTKPIDARNNRIWAIRAPAGSGLEQSRESYRDATNTLAQHVDELNKVLGDFMGEEGKLRQDSDRRCVLSFSTSVVMQKLPEYVKKAGIHDDFGFRLPQKWADQLPGTNEFTAIRKQTYYVVYNEELFEMSRKIQLYADMATEESDKYVVELRGRLRTTNRLPMFEISDAVSILDMICSFAQLSASLNYVRPELSDQLVLQGARNPIVETRMQNYIPSDVYLGNDSHRCLILNGGNMSGKSTLVKTVGLIQIMGQMGCFVPANYAQLPICKEVFTRLSTEDKPENNLGTFGVEATDMNLILRHATEDSLILIDELGRGTSQSDGLALAKAMVLDLVETKTRLIFATHFTEIGPELREKKPTMITCRHFTAQADSDPNTGTRQITITHNLAAGPMQYRDYGIDLSRRYLPENITNFAHQVSDFLRYKASNAPEEDAARPSSSATGMFNKLKFGVRDIVKRLAKASDDVDSGTLAIEMKKLQMAALKRKDDLSAHVTAPPLAAHNAITHLPKALPPPVPQLRRPGGRPTEEQLMRWREEEKRVMHNNLPLSPRKRGDPKEQKEAEVEAAETPRKVYRGRVEVKPVALVTAPEEPAVGVNRGTLEEDIELDDFAEVSQMLENARGKVHAWLEEDGL